MNFGLKDGDDHCETGTTYPAEFTLGKNHGALVLIMHTNAHNGEGQYHIVSPFL